MGKVWAEAWEGQAFHLWSRLEELMEPWERNSGAAEPCGEQGCLVTWKEAGSETKEEREV